MNSLAVMLTTAQIEAAKRLHERLPQWMTSDAALNALAERFPGFSDEAVLLKAVTINSLYGTNVLAIYRMAVHIKQVIEKSDLSMAGPELVEEIALLPPSEGELAARRHHSFAAKFAHFFINSERFPVMDSYAIKMVRFHLGLGNYKESKEQPYSAFVENLRNLKTVAGLDVPNSDLDRYLWIAGEYGAFRKNAKAQISVEVRQLFTNPPANIAADLEALMPSILDKAFRGEL